MTSGIQHRTYAAYVTHTLRFGKSLLLCTVFMAAAPSAYAAADEAEPARQLVERADHIRFPRESFQVAVAITNSGESSGADVHKCRDLWVFMPDVSQPIRLPLAQRLTGQVANGDLARANFAGDYTPKILRKDSVEGNWYWVLELTAVDHGVTYDRVLYWINQADNRPYKAEFYTRSNRLMKTCFYQNFTPMQGAQRPARLLMIDNLNQGNKSTLDYSGMTLKELPDKIFTKDYLKKLQ